MTVEKGGPIQVATDAKTEFSRGTAAATLKDVAVGDKAVVHAIKHDERLIAQVVKLGLAPQRRRGSQMQGLKRITTDIFLLCTRNKEPL